MIRLPVLLFYSSEVAAFLSVSEAEIEMEPADVFDGLYEAFDADGSPLRLNIVPDVITPRGFWQHLIMLGMPAEVERVVITGDDQIPHQKEELAKRLREYIRGRDELFDQEFTSANEIQNMSLEDLIEIACPLRT